MCIRCTLNNETVHMPLLVRVCNQKLIFLFLIQTICCEYSKVPPPQDGSFEYPKHMLKPMGKKLFTILLSKILVI